MQYSDIHKAVFLERPNRFIAHCTVDGRLETVHVKNTGRCRELPVDLDGIKSVDKTPAAY